MSHIYIYPPDATDCTGIGTVGALLCTDAVFELAAGEFGELTLTHPIDPQGKWRALCVGAILRAAVPVRLCPEITPSGSYPGTVDVYRVATTATRDQRCIRSKPAGGRKKVLLAVGREVTVTGVADASDPTSRYRVRCGSASGWMDRGGLELVRVHVPVDPDPEGLEAQSPSYAVRPQLFRIAEADTDSNGGVTVRALRIAYDLLGHVTTYSENGLVSCRDACAGILSHTLAPHDFTIACDISDTRAGFDASDRDPVSALLSPEDGVTARWGAEIVSDDCDIRVLRRAGADRGMALTCGGSLTGVDMRADASNVATGIRPRGAEKDGTRLYLDGHIINGVHGYNYDPATHTCSDTLPNGYRFYVTPDGQTLGTVIVRDDMPRGGAVRIAVADADGATVDGTSSGVTCAVARRKLVAEAVARFEAGCDRSEISMDVDFTLLGDTAEYRQYRHLQRLFVYDTVTIVHAPLGIKSTPKLTRLWWDVASERVLRASFGALKDVTQTVSSWQIASLSGGKILPGTLGAAQMSDGAVSARHIQAGSVNADALQARSVTAGKIASGTITADEIDAASVAAGVVDTNEFTAAAADIAKAQIESADIDYARIKYLDAETATLKDLITRDAVTQKHFIETLQVDNAQMVRATVNELVLGVLDENGERVYRRLTVNADGGVALTAVEPSEYAIEHGVTDDGRGAIVETSIAASAISASDMKAVSALIDRLTAHTLDVGELVARDAFIDRLTTREITSSGDTLTLMADKTHALRIDDDGTHFVKSGSPNEVLIDNESVKVKVAGTSTVYTEFGRNYMKVGSYVLKRASDGGIAHIFVGE